ncbi:hypothetical protein HY496_00475 [Candidatus Woesearchaeota archaeon]|nr:hypothetical protein [Candidatus Woesearchaeota archaeon]
MLYLIRRQESGFQVTGGNENYLKDQCIAVPEELRESLPDQNVRLSLRHALGRVYGHCPPMVSVYLVPTNGSKNRERTLVETVILVPFIGNRSDTLEERSRKSLTGKEVREAFSFFNGGGLYSILADYLSRENK